MATLTTKSEPQSPLAEEPAKCSGTKLSLGKRLLYSTITLFISLLALVAAGEIVLRVAGWPASGYYLHGHGPLDMLPAGEPNGRYPANEVGEILAFEYKHDWKTNSHGFRDHELTPKQPGEYRIGLIGDSMVAGHGVEQNERFMELWFNAIAGKPASATVWNLGMSGTGTCDMTSAIERLVDIYELDEVVLAFFSGNELSDNEAWQKNQEIQDKISRGEAKPVSSHGNGWRRWLRENSRVATYMWVHSVQYLASQLAPSDDMNSLFGRMWPVTKEGLGRFKNAVGDRPLTIWYLPAPSEWDDEHWRAIMASERLKGEDRSIMRDAVVKWAEENDVPLVDLTPVLQGRKQSEVKYRVDGHWNAGGHRLVAEALVKNPNASHLQKQIANHLAKHEPGASEQEKP